MAYFLLQRSGYTAQAGESPEGNQLGQERQQLAAWLYGHEAGRWKFSSSLKGEHSAKFWPSCS